MKDNIDLIRILEREGIARTDGERGVENLNKLAGMLGYREDGLKYGSSLERFLQDNQGCIQVIQEWIDDNSHLWESELEEYVTEEENEDEECCEDCGCDLNSCMCSPKDKGL